MAISLYDQKETINERLERLPETLRLAILVSVFWPVFSFIYILDPKEFLHLYEFMRKFILMGVLPLVFSWGLWWALQGVKKEKHLKGSKVQ